MDWKQERKMIEEDWFPHHKAFYSRLNDDVGNSMERLIWREPGTTNYYIGYWFAHGTLAVFGDVGEAIYQWYPDIEGMAWIAGCSLEYFAGKCQASECGRGYEEWNERVAKERLKHHLEEQDIEWQMRFNEDPPWGDLYSQYEWAEWMRDIGGNLFESCDWYDVGMRIAPRCHGHLIGLQMAFKQLEDK